MIPFKAHPSETSPLTEQLKTILADPLCEEWMLANVKHGAAPAFVDGFLCFRFEDDADAARFRERWLAQL